MVEICEEKTEVLEVQKKGDKNVRSSDTVDNRTSCKKRKVGDDVRDIFYNSVKEMGKLKEMIAVCEEELGKYQTSVCLLEDMKSSVGEVAKSHFENLRGILKDMKTGLVRPECEIEKFTSHLNKLQEIIPVKYDESTETKSDDEDVSMNSPEEPDKPDSPVTSCSSPDSEKLSSPSERSGSEPVTSPELKIDTAGNSSQDSGEVETPEYKKDLDEEAREALDEYLKQKTGVTILSEIIQKQIAFQSLPSRVNSGESSFCESVSEDQYNQLDVAFQKDLSMVSTRLIQERITSLAERYQTTDKVLQHSVRILEKYADKAGGGSIYHINKNDVFVD